MDAWTLVLLFGQAAFAILGLRLMIRHVFPALGAIVYPQLIGDVWAPVLLMTPLMFHASRVGASVEGLGWAPLGGPVCIGLIGVGAALLVGAASMQASPVPRYASWCWGGTGLAVLALAVSTDLTFWNGQCAFALGAVMLWINTPEPERLDSTATASRANWAVLTAFVCALGQGGMALAMPRDVMPVSVAMMVAYGAAAAAAGVRCGGTAWGVRISGWTAAVGTLFGIGIISMSDVTPRAIAFAIDRSASMDPRVAHSLGSYALEGTALLFLPAVPLMVRMLPRMMQRGLAGALVGLAAALAAWRVASI